jgi:hypothetical protein
MRKVIFVRGLEIAHVPGSGSTSLLVRDYEGKDATAEVYKVDTALLAELRNHELQAAQELGRWDTKSEAAAFDPVEMVRLLSRGVQARREFWEAREVEAPAGTQTEE